MSTSTTRQLSALILAVRQRADFVNSQFVTDLEITSYINQSAFELYDLLIQKYGNDYYVANASSFVTNGQSDHYPLPTDFYKLLGVDLALSNTQDSWVTVKPFNFSDRNRYAIPNFQTFYGVTNLRYRLSGNQLWLTPIPAANQTMRVWYVPEMTALVNPTDVLDGISGWDEYVVVDACIKALAKEESDTSVFMAQKAGLIARIEAAAENRDAGSPMTVSDSQWGEGWYPTGSGSGYGGAF